MIYLISLTVIASIVAAAYIGMRREEAEKRRLVDSAFDGRDQLDGRQFFERYFEGHGVPFFVVSKIREILERELGADLSRLSSEDDFGTNLNFFSQMDSLVDVEIVICVEEEFGISLTDSMPESGFPTSIGGIVNLVWRKVDEKGNVDAGGLRP